MIRGAPGSANSFHPAKLQAPTWPRGGGLLFRVLEEIAELVEVLSDQGPVLVALDYLHWSDSSTLLAFRCLMRRLTEAPLLLIGTVRPVPRPLELGQILDDLRESGARFIQLQALDGSDAEALAQAPSARGSAITPGLSPTLPV